MKKIIIALVTLLLLPSFVLGQTTVVQGGTGLTTVPNNSFLVGSTTLRLQALSTSSVAALLTGTTSPTSLTNFWGGSLSGDIYNLNTGNVGIGTASPTQKFTISNPTDFSQEFLHSGAGTSWYLSNLGSNGFRIWDGNTAHSLNLLNNGNVGVDTTTPQGNFEVGGDGYPGFFLVDAHDGIAKIGDYNGITGNTLIDLDEQTQLITSYANGIQSTLGDNGFVVQDVRGPNLSKFALDSSVFPNVFYFLNNNVGIGTTTPQFPLVVTGTTTAPCFSSNNGVSCLSSDNNWIYTPSLGVVRTATSTNGARAAFFTATSTTATSTFAGFVGIGTSTPASRLDVNGTTTSVNFQMPITTSATSGVFYQGPDRFIHTYGNANLFMGQGAGNFSMVSDGGNVGLGQASLGSLSSGRWNFAGGVNSQRLVSSGSQNTSLGLNSLFNLTTGHDDFALGFASMFSAVDAQFNVGIGSASLFPCVNCKLNIAIGDQAGASVTNATGNTFVGADAGLFGGGNFNTTIGNDAGWMLGSSGDYNLFLGKGWESPSGVFTGSNTILIGQAVRAGLNFTGSNQLNIGNLIFGTGIGSDDVLSTGSIGIGTTTPSSKLDIWGNLNVATGTTPALFVNTTNGFTGIGTSNPQFALEIKQPGLATLMVDTGSGSNNGLIRFRNGGTSKWAVGNLGSDSSFRISTSTDIGIGSDIVTILSSGKVGIGTSTPNATLWINGSQGSSVTSTAIDLTIATTSTNYVRVTSTSTARTITLPICNGTTIGNEYTVKDAGGNAGTNNITIARVGTDTIDGATTKVLNLNYASFMFKCGAIGAWDVN